MKRTLTQILRDKADGARASDHSLFRDGKLLEDFLRQAEEEERMKR